MNSKRAEQIAALEGHLKRMKELEQKAEALAGVVMPKMEVWEAEWYRMEAELWLAQAKAKK